MDILTSLSVNPRLDTPLAQQIKQQLVWMIVSGQLKVNDSLPSVRALAGRLGVNINTVRSAYQKLELDGLVTTRQGLGTRVLPYDPARLSSLEVAPRSHTVGIIIPSFDNPFYHAFLQGVEEVAHQESTLLFVCHTHDDTGEARRLYGQLAAKGVDGVIVASHEIVQNQSDGGKGTPLPLVTVDWPDSRGYLVQLDLESAGYQATRHLLEHGHRRVGLITFQFDISNVRPVNQGYFRALRESGIEPRESWIAPVYGFQIPAGREAARMLLSRDDPPTAIFAITDMLALGAMQAIREAGLHVPEDIALVGFNDIPLAALIEPQLTTVAAPAYALGVEAMQVLRSLISGKPPKRKRILLPTSLVVRQSCGEHSR